MRDALGSAIRPLVGGRAAAQPRAGGGRPAHRGSARTAPQRVADAPATPPGNDRYQLALFYGGRRAVIGDEAADGEAPEPLVPALWQLHDRFILVQTARGLMIVDQHSAHERVLYEDVIGDLREGPRPGQRLLFPAVLDLTPVQFATWESYRGLLSRLGFEIEPFGGHAVAVSAVPAFRHAFDAESALAGLLDDLAAPGSGSADLNQHERVARLFACKAAIKAGARLATEEMVELIDRLFSARLPYDDVHGRPAMLQISLEDLERHFGRH